MGCCSIFLVVPAESGCLVLLLEFFGGGAARAGTPGAAAVSSGAFPGEGGNEIGEACHFLSELFDFQRVSWWSVRDGGNGGGRDFNDLIGHVCKCVEVHGVARGGQDHAYIGW